MSNTDPIGTQGATKIGDLQVAFEGDDSFANRLKDLVSTKAAAERALKDLNLGKEVKAAYAEARVATAAALAGAKEISEKAELERVASANQAATTVNNANDEAARVVKEAETKAAAIVSNARGAKDEADAYVRQKTTAADTAHAAAQKHESEALNARRQVELEARNHQDAAAEAQATTAAAKQTKADFESKIAKLNGFLADLQSS